MKLPRDITGIELSRALAILGYQISHQRGSHIRLTTQRDGEHHVTIPAHDPLKIGTLNAILKAVGDHAKLDRKSLLQLLFK